MGCGDEDAGLGVPGVGEFIGKGLPILAQGDCVYLSARVNPYSHCLHAILGGSRRQLY